MICPFCAAQATRRPGNPGCEMFVAEDTGCSTEVYDYDVSKFQCDDDDSHVFYADDEQGNEPEPRDSD